MSQIIVLDTHIWVWFITQEFERFPAPWRDAIETAEQVGVSPISCFDVALAHQRGRLELPCAANLWFQEALEPSEISLFPITPEVAAQAVNLSPIHRDPFDRLIITTAINANAKLASIDRSFSSYPELNSILMD